MLGRPWGVMRRRRTAAKVAAAALALLVTVLGQPAQGEPPPVRITAAADFGASTQTRAVLAGMAATGADAHLAVGDLSYGVTGAEQSWCDLVTGVIGPGRPFQLLSGNHESSGTNGNINDFSACLPNQLPGLVGTYGRQYHVDIPRAQPQVRYIAISPGLQYADGTWSYAAGTPRHGWVAAAIDGARAAGIPWVVFAMHKSCLSIGRYACDPGADLLRLLVAKRVDLVLHGHEHLYQRTHQLGHSAACPALTPDTFSSACLVDQDREMTAGAGTVFATVGTGGRTLRDVNPADPEAGYFAASSGLNSQPTWGFLDVQVTATALSAKFVPAEGTFTDAFTLTKGALPPNSPPTAVAAPPVCAGLSCSFDGSGSTDPDGTVVGHTWDFGDGSTVSGAQVTHTYRTAGTYEVTLTVTDDRGATASTRRSVTVTAPTELASDRFERTLTGTWGSATAGGAWSPASSTNVSVSQGTGRLRMGSASSGTTVSLPGVSSSSTDLQVSVALDKPATGGGTYLSVLGRRVSGVGDYRLKLRVVPDGGVGAALSRTATGAEPPSRRSASPASRTPRVRCSGHVCT